MQILERFLYAISLLIMLVFSIFIGVIIIVGICCMIVTFPLWIVPHIICAYPFDDDNIFQGEE